MPVLRLRDARALCAASITGRYRTSPQIEITARQLDFLPANWSAIPAKFIGRSDPSGAIGHGATA
ncbi:hypothetical protein LNQ52_30430 [Klebsiella pneumoniae subsp. pneumoniae]|nr:hypothetical protein [Klebsiella pneumoniae subsp. pneumoniae]